LIESVMMWIVERIVSWGWQAKSKNDALPEGSALVHGETGNRTQNLLHSTCAAKYDAKKMSYH
jgi:hypothetical protein